MLLDDDALKAAIEEFLVKQTPPTPHREGVHVEQMGTHTVLEANKQ